MYRTSAKPAEPLAPWTVRYRPYLRLAKVLLFPLVVLTAPIWWPVRTVYLLSSGYMFFGDCMHFFSFDVFSPKKLAYWRFFEDPPEE